MASSEGTAPEYHIELRERLTMVWNFRSLLFAIQMVFSVMLVDETATLKMCMHYNKAFFTENREQHVAANDYLKETKETEIERLYLFRIRL